MKLSYLSHCSSDWRNILNYSTVQFVIEGLVADCSVYTQWHFFVVTPLTVSSQLQLKSVTICILFSLPAPKSWSSGSPTIVNKSELDFLIEHLVSLRLMWMLNKMFIFDIIYAPSLFNATFQEALTWFEQVTVHGSFFKRGHDPVWVTGASGSGHYEEINIIMFLTSLGHRMRLNCPDLLQATTDRLDFNYFSVMSICSLILM